MADCFAQSLCAQLAGAVHIPYLGLASSWVGSGGGQLGGTVRWTAVAFRNVFHDYLFLDFETTNS